MNLHKRIKEITKPPWAYSDMGPVMDCSYQGIEYFPLSWRCRHCYYRKVCEEGTRLLRKVARMKLKELPEYLIHERGAVREMAKMRVEKLCSG